MRVLLFALILTPFSSASAGPGCSQLEEMVSGLEQKLMNKAISGTCSSHSSQSLLSIDEPEVKDTVNKFRCSELSVVESELKKLENEVALLRGFEKLKDDIRAEKDRTSGTNPKKAKEAGENFTKSVITAQSLELLFSENTSIEFLNSLRDALQPLPPEQKTNRNIFTNKVTSLCGAQTNQTPLGPCHKSFQPDEAALREINELLEAGPSEEQIKNWRAALAIEKPDGSPYSFNQMKEELYLALPKLSNGEISLSREELRAIRSLPDFKDAGQIKSLSALRSARDDFKMQTIFEEFKFLADDLKGRQQFEIQSKVSLLWKNIKNESIGLTEEERGACQSSYSGFESSRICLEALDGRLPHLPVGAVKNQIKNYSDSLRSGLNHLDTMAKLGATCLTPAVLAEAQSTGTLSPQCLELLPEIDSALSKKQNQILGLNAIKNKIGEENQRLMAFRNYALEQLVAQNCQNSSSQIGEFCEEFDLGISREAMVLSSDVLQIALVHVPPPETIDIEPFCEEEKLQSYEQKLCDVSDPPDESEDPAPKPAEESAPKAVAIDAEDSGRNSPVKEAFVQGSVNLAGTIMNSLRARPYNPYAAMASNYNPYPYSYYQPTLYNNPAYMQSIQQFNSLYYGSIGFYRPTMGYAPYTAYPVINSYSHQPQSSFFTPYAPLGP